MCNIIEIVKIQDTVKHVYFAASNFRDFRHLSKIAKLNTRKFLELPITTIFVFIEYQLFREMTCNILGII